MKNNVADLFDTYRQKLLFFIRDRIADKDEAEDILQDVFLGFIRAEETAPILRASGWLYRAARNRIIDKNRKKQEERLPVAGQEDAFVREVTEVLADEDRSPEKEYLRTLVWEELEKALDDLPPEQKYVFEQTELNGLSFKELSADSGVAIETLLSRKHYAVKHLRKQLKEIYEVLLSDE